MMMSFSKTKITKKVTDFILKNFYNCDNVDETDTIVIKRIDFSNNVPVSKQDVLNLITNSINGYDTFNFNVSIPYDVFDVVDGNDIFKMDTCKVTINNNDVIFLINNNMLIYVVKVKHNTNKTNSKLNSDLVGFLTNLEKNIHHYKILGEYIYINSDIFSSNILKKQLSVLEIEEETLSTSNGLKQSKNVSKSM